MTGHAAPLNKVYVFAHEVFAPGALVQYITRCKYATLAMMARNAGDLAFADAPSRLRSRLDTLIAWGLVRKVPQLRRFELTADGWRLLVETEAAYQLATERNS